MRVSLTDGKYVVAVSGGVDSVVLLDLLAKERNVKLVVAHFDHGIRPDSAADRLFVQSLAKQYGLPFVYDAGNLGGKASEAQARAARYAFLRRVLEVVEAKALVLAHHEDDLLETAVLNMMRGTGRKGLSSLQSTPEIYRPFLHVPKSTLLAYAKTQGLEWREDSTNTDPKYLRNHLRQHVMPRFDASARQQLKALIVTSHATNREIDNLLANLLHQQPGADMLDRHWFIMLPHDVARELMAMWLRVHGASFDKKGIERIVVQAKTLAKGKQVDVDARRLIVVKSNTLALTSRDR